MKYKSHVVDAICREIELRKNYLPTTSLDSIYFGGGTPSLLSQNELEQIFTTLARYYSWSDKTEITIEANPDDLTTNKLTELVASPVNRLSIGIQSFDEADLQYMNRAHSATEAQRCIRDAQDVGLTNISADLIYGSPTTCDKTWEDNITKMIDLQIGHISAYALTVEEGTALHYQVASGKSQPVDDVKAATQFQVLIEALKREGYDHYEISNFAKPDHYAIHNSNYWLGKPYLGLGPAAHSFDGRRIRSWNISHNPKYIKGIAEEVLPIEHETLSDIDAYNEYVLIRLRTIWGIDLLELAQKFGSKADHFKMEIQQFVDRDLVVIDSDVYRLTDSGKMMGDKISMEVFI